MEEHKLNKIVSKILAAGIYSTIFFYIIGVIILLFKHNEVHSYSFKNFYDILIGLLNLDAISFLYTGTITLILTPILRVFISVFFFFYNKDKKFFYITLLVSVILLLSIFAGILFSIKLG